MNKELLRNGPFVWVKAHADGPKVIVIIENHDPHGIGIMHAELVINCGSNVAAADWLSYFHRDLDFDLELKQTFM